MLNLLLRWAVAALALVIVSYVVPGITLRGATAILVAPLLIGFVNATLGNILKFISFPFRLLTFGLLTLVINALMFMLAGNGLIQGFRVDGFVAAFIGSILLTVVTWVLRQFLPDGDSKSGSK